MFFDATRCTHIYFTITRLDGGIFWWMRKHDFVVTKTYGFQFFSRNLIVRHMCVYAFRFETRAENILPFPFYWFFNFIEQ